MAEVLSQEEIDSLLEALGAGDAQGLGTAEEPASAVKVRPYDFYRPSKFSKEQIRTLNMIHETFCRLWSSKLSGLLRNYVSMGVSNVDQVTYQEFINSIPNPTITGSFSMEPLEGRALLEFSPSIGFPIIDRLLGGSGHGSIATRELTEIETQVLGNLLDDCMLFLRDAWSSMIELSPELVDIESNPLFVQIVPPIDMVLLITVEVRIGGFTGILNLVYPYVLLEPILSLLSSHVYYSVGTKAPSPEQRLHKEKLLSNVCVETAVELGRTNCSLRQLLELEAGDLLVLGTRAAEDLLVMVSGIPKFRCTPGLHGRHRAVQVTDRIEEEEVAALSAMHKGAK